MKKPEENCNFPFFLKIFAPLEAKMMKHEKQMIKNDKDMKKTRGKLQFSIFWKMFAPLEAKMMKKNMIKKWKNSRKITILHFLENFGTTGSKNDETWQKNDKTMIKKWKKHRGKLQFSIFWKMFAPLEANMMNNF